METVNISKIEFVEDYKANAFCPETNENGYVEFRKGDEISFTSAEIFQIEGINTFSIEYEGYNVFVYIPSSVLFWHLYNI